MFTYISDEHLSFETQTILFQIVREYDSCDLFVPNESYPIIERNCKKKQTFGIYSRYYKKQPIYT